MFLDRNGTINVGTADYVYKPEHLELIAGAAEAIRALNESRFKLVVVTDQSGVGLSRYYESQVRRLHGYIQAILKSVGASIDSFYCCPHHPEATVVRYTKTCSCRKPEPGMIFRAARELDIDLERSWMIGDQPRDIEAGLAAACRGILLRQDGDAATEDSSVVIMPDLFQAAIHVIDADGRRRSASPG